MSLYVLDTDHASLLQRGHQQVARQIAAAMQSHEIAVTQDLRIAAITVFHCSHV